MPSDRPEPPELYTSWIDWALEYCPAVTTFQREAEEHARDEYADLLAELEKLRAVAKAAEAVQNFDRIGDAELLRAALAEWKESTSAK